MSTPLLICVKAADGGLFVALFAVLGEMLHPKRFAGIFGASPAVALANVLVIALAKGDGSARTATTGMVVGAIAMTVACVAAIPAVRRWGAARGSGVLWSVWIVVAGAAAIPVAGAPAPYPRPLGRLEHLGSARRQAAGVRAGRGPSRSGPRPGRRTGRAPAPAAARCSASTSKPGGRYALAPWRCGSPSAPRCRSWPGWSECWPGRGSAV